MRTNTSSPANALASNVPGSVTKQAYKTDKAAVDAALATALDWMQHGAPAHEVKSALRAVQETTRAMPLGPSRLAKLSSIRSDVAAKREAMGDGHASSTTGGTRIDPAGVDDVLSMFNDGGAFLKSSTVSVAAGLGAAVRAQAGFGTQVRPNGERQLTLTLGLNPGFGAGAMVGVSRHALADSDVGDSGPAFHNYRTQDSHVGLGVGGISRGGPHTRAGYRLEMGSQKREHGKYVGGGVVMTSGNRTMTVPLFKLKPSMKPVREALGIDLKAALT